MPMNYIPNYLDQCHALVPMSPLFPINFLRPENMETLAYANQKPIRSKRPSNVQHAVKIPKYQYTLVLC